MRPTRFASFTFPSSRLWCSLAAVSCLAACGQTTASPDAGDAGDASIVGADTGIVSDAGVDSGRDASFTPDAGRAPLCTGTGCDIVGIEALTATTCVLRANGQVDCWGRGQDGELGDGAMHHTDECRLAGETNVDCARDGVTVRLPGPAERIVSRGAIQSCASLRTSHQIWCWGGLRYRIGSTLEHDQFAPEHLLVNGMPVADGSPQNSMSYGAACWVNTDGTASCIGYGGSSGRLGIGTFMDSATPVAPLLPDASGPIRGVLEIETNGAETCARTATRLYCWGSNQYGQLGVPPPHQTCVAAPTRFDCSPIAVVVPSVDAAHVVDMQLDGDYVCVVLDTGHVLCWGSGASGGLGRGNVTSTNVPMEPTGLSNVAELRIASGAACALLRDGTVRCWGSADQGQIGDGRMAHDPMPCVNEDGSLFDCQLTPVQVPGITDGVHLAAGSSHFCVVRASGQVWCWGQSQRYQLGNEMRVMPAFAPVMSVAQGS